MMVMKNTIGDNRHDNKNMYVVVLVYGLSYHYLVFTASVESYQNTNLEVYQLLTADIYIRLHTTHLKFVKRKVP